MQQCGARFIEHLAQRHVHRLQVRQPACQRFVGQAREQPILSGAERTFHACSFLCRRCGSEHTKYYSRRRARERCKMSAELIAWRTASDCRVRCAGRRKIMCKDFPDSDSSGRTRKKRYCHSGMYASPRVIFLLSELAYCRCTSRRGSLSNPRCSTLERCTRPSSDFLSALLARA